MDKNTGIGLALIAAIVIGFSILTKPTQEEVDRQQRYQDSIKNTQVAQAQENIATPEATPAVSPESEIADFFDVKQPVQQDSTVQITDSLTKDVVNEQFVFLENNKVKIKFTTLGGQVSSVLLKDYKTYKGDSLYLVDADANMSLELMNKKGIRLNTDKATFRVLPSDSDAQTLTMRMNYSDTQYVDFVYTLAADDYMLKFDVAVVGLESVLSVDCLENFILKWQQNIRRQENNTKSEQQFAKIHYKTVDSNFEELSEANTENREVTSGTKWIAFKDQFFSSILIADDTFRNANLSSKPIQSDKYLKDYAAVLSFKPATDAKDVYKGNFKYFFGPLDYYMLKGYDDDVKETAQRLDLDRLIPLGWTLFRVVNKYLVMPLFDLLNSTGMQMGLVIFLLTLIVKLVISPLTYKSFMSSAKMRVLKPQVDELNEKYPGQDKAMEKQKAVMQLYSQAGVNPMSGCIPMLLQMPILIALFSFFPSAIELRQQSFLWADDLSTYDTILSWDANIPFISSWLGNHISLFCILMTATNIIYTKFNMDATNTGQQQMPGMKWMMMLMPLVFFFVLNSYPSGLNYYYFLSTLMTILITIGFRYVVDEKKVLAKLEENKKKPKKKGLMSRLQEQAEQAQRQQQAQAANKNKQNKKRK
ncbi:MAG: rane protein insertase YidC [Bacteroidota bacterium]|jgi:YidC/Oxa1 family membrane protein insertase